MKTVSKSAPYLVPLLGLVVGAIVYAAQRSGEASSIHQDLGNRCQFVDKECQIDHEKGKVKATFGAQPEPEESITVNVWLPLSEKIDSVWIEGVNMYMGKIPVFIEQQKSGEWTGWFMLGACSEPQMRWRMQITIKGRETPYIMFFDTKIP